MRLPTLLLHRKSDAHKGDFGHIFIVAGSRRYSGAGVLCSSAAMRSGAGKVSLGIPRSLNNAVIKIKPLEVMTFPLPETKEGTIGIRAKDIIQNFSSECDCMVVGCGLSQNKSTQELIRSIVVSNTKPLILDADGLNALKGNIHILKKRAPESRIVITPHPGEMARILGVKTAYVQKNREMIAKTFANDYNVTVVLKGHHTVIADRAGNSYLNKTGNPGMATAGSGDVLCGVIAAFIGQKLDIFNAAKYAVYIHGLAGDLAAKEKSQISLIASDIIDTIPEAIKRCS
ncbi:MAG: NAD(P)H-hydrate dehydratase [Candidatus Omnitrophota bacterium]|jgi:NAD(P)H-hydrate epimerase